MIVSSRIRVGRIVRRSWRKIIFVAGYSVLVVLLYQAGVSRATIPVAIPAMLGTALSILLGFRTNSAYDRWWEARKVWGAIVNDSRTLARQVLSLLKSPDETPRSEISAIQREMIHRQIAWNFVLARSLRGQDRFQDVGTMISPAEIESLSAQDNTTNAMLQTQENRLQDTLQSGYLDGYRFLPIENTLKRMCDHMGMCERIKSTVFPVHYGFLISQIIWLFFLLLPPGLVDDLGWITVPVATVTAIVFWMIEALGAVLQDPFENDVTDIPMLAISRTIEINLRQQLGETDLPEKFEPVDGVLM